MTQIYCSWCYHESTHRLIEKNYLRRNRYQCLRCKNTTYECRICTNMARGGKTWDDELCAEHTGELPSFRRLDIRLQSIEKSVDIFHDNGINGSQIASALLNRKLVRLLSGCVNDFNVTIQKPGQGRHGVIFINGFLSQNHLSDQDWSDHLTHAGYGDDQWYRVHWECCRLEEVLESMVSAGAVGALAAWKFHKSIPSAIAGVIGGLAVGSALPWYTALLKAEITGRLLGIAISRTPGWKFTLIGHSLGARVIHSTLTTLANILPNEQRVTKAILLGGAVDCTDDVDWSLAIKAVHGHLENGYSMQDDILRRMYQTSLFGSSNPAGLEPIRITHPRVRSHDCSALVSGHMDWKPKLNQVLKLMA